MLKEFKPLIVVVIAVVLALLTILMCGRKTEVDKQDADNKTVSKPIGRTAFETIQFYPPNDIEETDKQNEPVEAAVVYQTYKETQTTNTITPPVEEETDVLNMNDTQPTPPPVEVKQPEPKTEPVDKTPAAQVSDETTVTYKNSDWSIAAGLEGGLTIPFDNTKCSANYLGVGLDLTHPIYGLISGRLNATGQTRLNLCDKNAKERILRARYFLILSKDYPINKNLFVKPYVGLGANYTSVSMDYPAYDYKHDYSGFGASATAGIRFGAPIKRVALFLDLGAIYDYSNISGKYTSNTTVKGRADYSGVTGAIKIGIAF